MGLTETESIGLRRILEKMTVKDVFSLANTITLRMIAVQNLPEAVNAIICYADSAIDVLSRKKLKKEYIFKYLHDVGAPVQPNAEKLEQICAVLAYWGSNEGTAHLTIESEDDAQIEENEGPIYASTDQPLCRRDQIASNFTDEVHQMALAFARWFFPILSDATTKNPQIANNSVSISDIYGPHHFWRDCRLRIRTPANEELAAGSENVATILKCFLQTYGLRLNPFDTEAGVKAWSDPHGLVSVLVGGAVHKNDRCLGVFEQVFGLIRDPAADNNWKIKFTEIRLNG